MNGAAPTSAVRRPAGERQPVDPRGMVGELLAHERVGARRRRVDRHVPARAARRRDRGRDRRGPAPDEERVAWARRARRTCGPRSSASAGSVSSIATERAVRPRTHARARRRRRRRSRSRRGAARPSAASAPGTRRAGRRCRGRSARCGRRSAASAGRRATGRPRRRCRSARRARGDAPGGVDAGAFVDDRDRAVRDRAAHVRDGARGREAGVHRAHRQA